MRIVVIDFAGADREFPDFKIEYRGESIARGRGGWSWKIAATLGINSQENERLVES